MNALPSRAWMPQVEAASATASLVQSSSCGGGRASVNASADKCVVPVTFGYAFTFWDFRGRLKYHRADTASKVTLSCFHKSSGSMDLSFSPRGHKNPGVVTQHRRMAYISQGLPPRRFSSAVKESPLGQLSVRNSSCSGLGLGLGERSLRSKCTLSSRSHAQQVLSSNSGSKLAVSHGSCLSERIASSQFCSSSKGVVRWGTVGGEVRGVVERRHFLGKFGQRRVRRSVAAAMSADGLKQVNLFGPDLYSRWSERRIQRAPPIAVGRGPPPPASENWDIGDYRIEPDTGMDNFGDVSFGDESVADDVELSSDLAAARFGHDDTDNSLRHADSEDSEDMTEDPKSFAPWQDWISKRWGIVILCFFAFLLCNMDRVNMSIAILPMSSEYHWSPTTVGLVQSSFFWGYLLTQVAGGIWADSIGGKQVLGFGVIWWSLATVATPIAAKIGLPVLFFVRACMGVGEGVAMPAMNNLLSKWIPVGERSRSLALVYSGMYLGSVIGLACSPSLIHRFGWPSVFFTFGSVGTIWFAVWERYAQSSPGEDPTLSDAERNLIFKTNKPREPITDIPWGLLLSKAPVWALIVSHFCHNWGTFILLTWMPTYYHQVLGFNLTESGLFSVLPWLTMAISANVGGWIADTLVSKGMSVTTVRKIMQSIGFLGPAFFLTQLSHIREPHLAVLCMMASQGSDAFSQSGLYSNHQDIGPRYSGILLGLSNTAGVLAGVLGTAATGYILQHGTWDDVFKVAVGLYLLGTVVWNVFSTGEQLFD